MSYNQIFNIASAAMSLEKLRFDVAANNVANQHSLHQADGSAFQAETVQVQALPFSDLLENSETPSVAKVELVPQNLPPNKVYQPAHPEADAQGFVSYPGLSMVDEMTTMMRSTRAYEANIKIINMARGMYLQALSIGEER